jgi:hypothetical protein
LPTNQTPPIQTALALARSAAIKLSGTAKQLLLRDVAGKTISPGQLEALSIQCVKIQIQIQHVRRQVRAKIAQPARTNRTIVPPHTQRAAWQPPFSHDG